ncbi:MAG: hypothetical protein CTY37_02740 [Methylotenera sp.]|nr:MAG: hypothetical protein CTY37_02740 [Methylotenera sp.]PPD11894.1 MAG: hypothetical protein CTY27_06725 [Methylotenera sp.]
MFKKYLPRKNGINVSKVLTIVENISCWVNPGKNLFPITNESEFVHAEMTNMIKYPISILDGKPGGNRVNFLPLINKKTANESEVSVSLSMGGISG